MVTVKWNASSATVWLVPVAPIILATLSIAPYQDTMTSVTLITWRELLELPAPATQ